MSMTNTEHRAQLNAARRRMTAFVAAATGAELDARFTGIVDDHVVLAGAPAEVEKVRAHFTDALGVAGVVVDQPAADDPDFAFVRIPEAACTARLGVLTAR